MSHARDPDRAAGGAADPGVPANAIAEQTAIKAVDDSVEIVSEGRWKRFPA